MIRRLEYSRSDGRVVGIGASNSYPQEFQERIALQENLLEDRIATISTRPKPKSSHPHVIDRPICSDHS